MTKRVVPALLTVSKNPARTGMLLLLDIENLSNCGSNGIVGIVEGVLEERQWERADVLKVDHPDAMVCVSEEVVLVMSE